MPRQRDNEQPKRFSFSSDDEAEITEFIRLTSADSQWKFDSIRDGARFTAVTHDTPVLGVDRVSSSVAYQGSSSEGFSDYLFLLVHSGNVQVDSPGNSTIITRGGTGFYPLGVPVRFNFRDYEVNTLRLPHQRLDQVAEDTAGIPAARLRFHDISPVSASWRRYWKSLMSLVTGAVTEPDSPLKSPLLAEDMARTVATAALHTFPNTAMDQHYVAGPGAISSKAVRRAASYIETHAASPLQLNDIADAAGTGVRALQYGFHRHLNTSPMGYLRQIRLERARQDLRRADPENGETVTAVAHRWGFANVGRFAAAYRKTYGVNPSHTLWR
ncbi:helix-turn-helix transcriptional regulator [Brevibacterium sediminis]|uniref:helix-turn-helix transcriptional regulator n=1 Tax=Brevibacterium sediminis TaxID=1857024 RepID=UPI00366D7633